MNVRGLRLAVLFVCLSQTASAQEAAVSAVRVGEGLQRPALIIPTPQPEPLPTFRVETRGTSLETALDAMRRDLATNPGWNRHPPPAVFISPPLITVDVLPLVYSAARRVGDARRRRQETNARRLVADDLAAFCALYDCLTAEPIEGVIVPER